MLGMVVGLGLVVWLVTTLLVESEITRPLRDWLDMKADVAATWLHQGGDDVTRKDGYVEVFWRKMRYLVGCHLCSGCWVAAGAVAVVPLHVFRGGVVGFVLDAALVKAVAHLVLAAHKAGEAVAR